MKNKLEFMLVTSALLLSACQKEAAPVKKGDDSVKTSVATDSTRIERCEARYKKWLAGDDDDGGRIVGGEPAKPNSARWQIAILSEPNYTEDERDFDTSLKPDDECKNFLNEREDFELAHKCGGSYIGDGWILTAAHCVNKIDNVTQRHVIMGTQNLNANVGKFEIDSIVIHGGYKKDKMNDIALIKLKEDERIAELTENKRLEPVELMTQSDRVLKPKEFLRVTGWGYMGQRSALSSKSGEKAYKRHRDSAGNIQRKPAQLQQLSIRYLADEMCAKQYSSYGDGSICAGATVTDDQVGSGKDSCQGDSGGPLTRAEVGGKRKLVGIVSLGKGCGAPGIPAVYVRVSYYQDWIKAAKQDAVESMISVWPESTPS